MHLREELLARSRLLPGVSVQTTELSVPAEALVMEETFAEGQPEAFIRSREFALIRTDGSVHLPLMPEWGEQVLKLGWASIHPLVRYLAGALPPQNVIVYAPRNEEELEIVWKVIQAAHSYAWGWLELE